MLNCCNTGYVNIAGKVYPVQIDPEYFFQGFLPSVTIPPCFNGFASAFAMGGDPNYTTNSGCNGFNSVFTSGTYPNYTTNPGCVLGAGSIDENSAASTVWRNGHLNSCLSQLTSAISTIEAAMKQEGLNETQKGRLQQIVDKMKALEPQIKELINNSQSTYKQISEAKQKVQDLITEAQNAASEIAAEVQSKQEETKDDETSPSEAKGDNKNIDGIGEVDTKTGKPASLADENTAGSDSRSNVRDLCTKFNNAVNDSHWYTLWTCGTDDEKFEEALNELNPNNIIEVMEYYKKNYGQSFIDDFLGDAEHYQKREFGGKILDALITRAEANGMDDEIEKEIVAIRSELNDANISKGIVSKHIKSIYQKIKDKEKSNVSSIEKEEKAEKAKGSQEARKAKEKEQEENTQTINQFKDDMREIWKDDKAEISDKVKYKDGQFQIRIEGKNYYGSDFNELVKNIEDAGYDPKKYLQKQPVDVAA